MLKTFKTGYLFFNQKQNHLLSMLIFYLQFIDYQSPMSSTNLGINPIQAVYTQNDINSMKATLQDRFGLQLVINRMNNTQLYIMCQNERDKSCTFFCMFMKKNGDPKQKKFNLVVDSPIHSPQCISTKKSNSQKSELQESEESLAVCPSAQKQVKIEERQGSQSGMNIEDSDYIHDRQSKTSINKRKRNSPNSASIQGQRRDQNQPLKALYLQNEVSALKKNLIHKYKALISKSTHVDPQTNLTTRITFRCKNAQKNQCDFLQRLVAISSTLPLVYKLDSICSEHRKQCLMDPQQLRYNQITKVIDKSTGILEKIIVESLNKASNTNGGGKPKQILQSLAAELGQQNGDFIYNGLSMKTHRRAIKKYFDNAVGKIRAKIKI